ncbi:MAG TPA: sulfide-dependent adenosine diphosphate thiazole synthase [Dehalococcoidia bacterium]|nr:sulfide-dependent adenosine diphosphate thiazole synthase [Dehalococcoidia bacterium]
MDEVTISRAITETFLRDFMEAMEVDVAIAGAGPSGLIAAYYLAKGGARTVVFERQLRVGGGMPGGGMMFNRIVLQEEGKRILDDFGVRTKEYEEGYYIADALETISTLCSKAIKAGARIFNLISVEDVMIREENRITGLVLNWSAVSLAKLHVDPLTIRSKVVIDATGHESEVCHIVVRKIGSNLRTATGGVVGEKPMWAEKGEREIVENTKEVYPGLIVAGMAANAVFGSPRMGAIFGGMLLSGKRAAELAHDILAKEK